MDIQQERKFTPGIDRLVTPALTTTGNHVHTLPFSEQEHIRKYTYLYLFYWGGVVGSWWLWIENNAGTRIGDIKWIPSPASLGEYTYVIDVFVLPRHRLVLRTNVTTTSPHVTMNAFYHEWEY